MSSWSTLGRDIGCVIMDWLPEVVEHVRFGAVCKGWYGIAKDYYEMKPQRRALPMLLVPPISANGTKPNLYALSCRGNFYRELTVPLAHAHRYCGSSYGWLATQNPDYSVTLEYPFSDKVSNINLPMLAVHPHMLPEFSIHKLVVAPNSTPDDYVVAAIYGSQNDMAIIKSGNQSWVLVDGTPEVGLEGSAYCDLIFHKGLVYALTNMYKVVSIDVNARPPLINLLLSPVEDTPPGVSYIVESSQMELFLVERRVDYAVDENEDERGEGDIDNKEKDEEEEEEEAGTPTIGFTVYKLHTDKMLGKMELLDLSGDALFVGDNVSMSFAAKDYPGCESDTIYFNDDLFEVDFFHPDGPDDVGSYNLKKKSFDKHYIPKKAQRYLPPTTWIVPPTPNYQLTFLNSRSHPVTV